MVRRSKNMSQSGLGELNITPLMDLCFTLLIIFMISTPLVENQLPVNLPESRSSTPAAQEKKVRYVTIDSTGLIRLDNEYTSTLQLEATLKRIMLREPETIVSLRADAKLEYQKLVQVLDAIRNSGAKLALSTVPKP